MPREHTHTKRHEGRTYDILALIKALEDREVLESSVADLPEPRRDKKSGFSKKRLKNTDLQYPLLVSREMGEVMDGRHRLIKAIEEGREKVQYKDVTQEDLEGVEVKESADDTYVLSAVPAGAESLLQEHGLLSSEAMLSNPTVLKSFLSSRKGTPMEETEDEFRDRVTNKLKDNFWGDAMKGPSVFFGEPDQDKITDVHPMRKLKAQTFKINLSKLMEDHPKTRISGTELVPYDPKGPRHQGHLRHKDIDMAAVRRYAATDPKELWKHYDSPEGTHYASDVPHAQIITPMGHIPPEYIVMKALEKKKKEQQPEVDSVVDKLKAAKKLSDNRMYTEKNQTLHDLIKQRPDEFFVDSREGNILGITHRPSNFRIHMRAEYYPETEKVAQHLFSRVLLGLARLNPNGTL